MNSDSLVNEMSVDEVSLAVVKFNLIWNDLTNSHCSQRQTYTYLKLVICLTFSPC